MSATGTEARGLHPPGLETGATPKAFLYRGWTMVAVAAVAMVATLPGRTHGLGMITERVLADPRIGLDRTSYGHLNLWATLIGALFCLGIGRLIDRVGSRVVLTAVLVLLALAVFGMSFAGSATAFFVAVTLTRGFGQSALSVVSITLVGKWFRRRLGFAMGVYTVLMAVGFMAAYRGGLSMKDADWRAFWNWIGFALLAFVPVAWLLTRDTPESCGLPPDGQTPAEGTVTAATDGRCPTCGAAVAENAAACVSCGERLVPEAAEPAGASFTLGQALATPAFWVFALGTSAFGLVSAGVALFNESLFVDLGFDKSLYYAMLSFGVPFGLASNLTTGWLANRVPLGKLAAAALLVMAAALALLPRLHSETEVRIYTAVYAAAGGAMTVLFFTVWGRLYGRTHLGRIQAAAQMLTVLASAVGPLAFAWARDASGSYAPAVWTSAAVIAMLGAAAAVVRMPASVSAEHALP
jgi:MFS family permease